jgi:hypothetical protein
MGQVLRDHIGAEGLGTSPKCRCHRRTAAGCVRRAQRIEWPLHEGKFRLDLQAAIGVSRVAGMSVVWRKALWTFRKMSVDKSQ